jgi:hypothetical protein
MSARSTARLLVRLLGLVLLMPPMAPGAIADNHDHGGDWTPHAYASDGLLRDART